jgi:replicative DNA helicase
MGTCSEESVNSNPDSTASEAQVLPFSAEAERGLLGAIMQDPDRAWFAARTAGVAEDALYLESHRQIWNAIERVFGRHAGIDAVTVQNELRAMEVLDEVGGASGLAEIIDTCATPAYVTHYADIVMDKFTRRQTIHACHEIMAAAYDGETPATELLPDAQTRLLSIGGQQAVEVNTLADYREDQIEQWTAARGRGYSGIPSCLTSLNTHLGGYRQGIEIILAGYRGEGKSTFARQEALHKAQIGIATVLFTPEDPGQMAAASIVGNYAQQDILRLDTGKASEAELVNTDEAWRKIEDLPLYIVSAPMTIGDVVSIASHLYARYKIGFVILDHIQFLQPYRLPHMTRNDTLGSYSSQIVATAKRLHLPFMCLSQLSRDSEKQNRKPKLSDLRDSGTLEQDARQVVLLYWDGKQKSHVFEVAKNNAGASKGRVLAQRMDGYQRFEEIEALETYGAKEWR